MTARRPDPDLDRPGAIPQDAWDIATLAPGESRLWSFHYAPEGSANFRATDGSLSLEAQPEERVFLGIGQPTEV